jgi:hypothetical protein
MASLKEAIRAYYVRQDAVSLTKLAPLLHGHFAVEGIGPYYDGFVWEIIHGQWSRRIAIFEFDKDF